MALKYALLLTARDKVRHVAAAVQSMFAQVGPPIELLLSDQGSTDGTDVIMDELAGKYDGPHKVRRLNCPDTELIGMPGMNAHVSWAMTQTDADVVMQLSADDYDLAQRAELTRKAFEERNPSMVCVSQYYVNEKMEYQGETPHSTEDRWLTIEDMTVNLMGGSTCQAWTREFWGKIGGLQGVGSMDVVMPPLAVMDKGAWLVKARAHCYRKVTGLRNTGLEGVYYHHPEGSKERLQLAEVMHYQISAGYYAVLQKMDDAGWRKPEWEVALANCILDRAASWVTTRNKMTFDCISPIPFKI